MLQATDIKKALDELHAERTRHILAAVNAGVQLFKLAVIIGDVPDDLQPDAQAEKIIEGLDIKDADERKEIQGFILEAFAMGVDAYGQA